MSRLYDRRSFTTHQTERRPLWAAFLFFVLRYRDPTLKHRGGVGSPFQGFAYASPCAGLSLRVIDSLCVVEMLCIRR